MYLYKFKQMLWIRIQNFLRLLFIKDSLFKDVFKRKPVQIISDFFFFHKLILFLCEKAVQISGYGSKYIVFGSTTLVST